MAGPTGGQVPQTSSRVLCRCIALIILIVLVIVGLVILITWLAIRPRGLGYTIEDGKVRGFELHNNHLNASFDFIIKAHNPNRKVSVYYDSIEVSVSYNDQIVAFQTVEPFYQPRKNVTRLEVKPKADSVPLIGSVSKALRHEKRSGEVEFEVRLKAWIRFKVGIWKSHHYTLKVYCSPDVHLDPTRAFERTYCDVDT